MLTRSQLVTSHFLANIGEMSLHIVVSWYCTYFVIYTQATKVYGNMVIAFFCDLCYYKGRPDYQNYIDTFRLLQQI